MKAFRLRATTRSERLALFFYSLCLLIMLATRFLHPRHGGQGWSLFLIPVAFFLLLLWNIRTGSLAKLRKGRFVSISKPGIRSLGSLDSNKGARCEHGQKSPSRLGAATWLT